MIFSADVVLIEMKIFSKGFFKIVFESFNNEFIVDGFFFEKRLKIVFVKEESR